MITALRKIVAGIVSTAPLPLMIFVAYAYRNGEPDFERWVQAYQLGFLAAAIHLVLLWSQGEPINRIVLGGNVYLAAGGIAAVTDQVRFLEALDRLQETSLMIAIVGLGVMTTFFSRAGYIGVTSASGERIRRYSLWLLAGTILALVGTLPYRGDPFLAGFLPIVGLIALQKLLSFRLKLVGVAAGSR